MSAAVHTDESTSSYSSFYTVEEREDTEATPRRKRSRMSEKERRKRSKKRTCLLVCRVAIASVLVFVYCGAAAGLMYHFESPNELREFAGAIQLEKQINSTIFDILLNFTNDADKSRNLTTFFIESISKATADNGSFKIRNRDWDPIQSFFFAATLITSIGFGNVSPETVSGRIFTVLIAMFGLPLAVLLLANLGKLLSRIFKSCLKPFSKSLSLLIGSYIALLGFGLVFIIFIPAVVFLLVEENWTYWESLYFCFITLSTIGFGDVVVLGNDDRPPSDVEELFYALFIVVWLFVGLAYLALIIQEVVVLLSLIWKVFLNRFPWCRDSIDEEFEERPLEKLISKAGRKVKTLTRTIQNSNVANTLTQSIRIKRDVYTATTSGSLQRNSPANVTATGTTDVPGNTTQLLCSTSSEPTYSRLDKTH